MMLFAKPRLCAMLAGGERLLRYAMVMLFMTLGSVVYAQTQKGGIAGAVTEGSTLERSISEWLIRIHEASRRRAYVGTFVVSAGGSLSSSRIWHVCDGEQQMERVESLTGTPRATFRRNDQVITFLPESHVAVNEKRESLSLFPNLLQNDSNEIILKFEKYYSYGPYKPRVTISDGWVTIDIDTPTIFSQNNAWK